MPNFKLIEHSFCIYSKARKSIIQNRSSATSHKYAFACTRIIKKCDTHFAHEYSGADPEFSKGVLNLHSGDG